MKSGYFSVIIPCYKMGKFVGAALESVGAQEHGAWEVIVVDDCGPEDGTKEIVEAFGRKWPDHRVLYIRHRENGGVSAARNTAIEASEGEFLAFLDPDDLWRPNHLTIVSRAFQEDTKPDLVTGPVIRFSGDSPVKGGLWQIADWKKERFPASLACHNFIQPCATVVRSSALEQVGLFVTDPLLQHIEDYDLWIRLAKAGKRFWFLEDATSYYREHPGAATSDPLKIQVLGDRLAERHIGFFIRSHGKLLETMNTDLARLQPVAKVVRRVRRVFRF